MQGYSSRGGVSTEFGGVAENQKAWCEPIRSVLIVRLEEGVRSCNPTFRNRGTVSAPHVPGRGGRVSSNILGHILYLGACADISTEPTIPPLGVWPMRYSRFVRRIPVTGEASVRSCATEDSEDGTLLDVSRKGARLCLNRLFRPGQKLTLMMNLPWDEPPVEVRLATVKWVHQDTVGVEFLKVENDDRVLLDVFLASRSKLPAKER